MGRGQTGNVADLAPDTAFAPEGGEPSVSDDEPIQRLFAALSQDLRKDPNGPNVKALMQEYASKYTDWKEYAHFCDHKYARNLVNADEYLELIVLCWLPHQQSPIHNHAGQHCWAAVLEGTMQETHFLYQDTHSCCGHGPLVVESVHKHQQGQVSYIDDGIALHVLQPLSGQRGITLHLYSRPIPGCNIYDAATGMVTSRKCGFFTIKKKLQPEQGCTPCSAAASQAFQHSH